MKSIEIYQVDAFTDQLFAGNPAAVCPLDKWLNDDLLQKIALENCLPETAFFVHRIDNIYDIKWFTPEIEMDLCGHATLASAHVLFNHLNLNTKIQPNEQILNEINLDPGGIIITAQANKNNENIDFVSRFFTPQSSILEDPVTGSAHCSLIPYWSEQLQKDSMIALQISKRIGKIFCQNLNDRVLIGGTCQTYLKGHIYIPFDSLNIL
ncbi:hypothetical protein I4U23_027686 [Adineta vaga]|nr:hypothetical protein I4U23_027686 [Adineta vaga]